MKKSIIFSALAASLLFTSCDDLFEPAIENNLGFEYMYGNPEYAEGVLGNAYTRIPCGSFPFSEVATDDAVSNDPDNSYRKIAAGQWTSNNNPLDTWTSCRSAIMYINLFLANADKVAWADDEVAAKMFCEREKGEAYGLRAMYMYYLLRAHGGVDKDGNLLGVQIVTEPETTDADYNKPRNTFKECMDSIYADCERALQMLPTKYYDVEDDAAVPAKYKSLGANANQYNRVFGEKFTGRMCGAYVEAFRAKASLLAASPAFAASGITMTQAADYAAQVLDRIGGVAGMASNGWTWYANTAEIDALQGTTVPKECLWRGERSKGNSWESDNYPPSVYGNGRVNPTQNFVDAFPTASGYPITDARSGYSASNPYADRDPRLAAYVVYNGQKVASENATIITATDGNNQDAINNLQGKSTRTGYYMRKLLRQDISLNPSNKTEQYHYTPRIRFTEMFLVYAEAANEAYGPTGKGSHGYSAYDVIKAIRSRAGIGELDINGDNSDPYLDECAQSKEKMRELIRNERRIELSFEGFRFWDLRRWQEPINVSVKGMSINQTANTYTPIDVDKCDFKEYMIYGPIPYSECLKFSNLQQNKGW